MIATGAAIATVVLCQMHFALRWLVKVPDASRADSTGEFSAQFPGSRDGYRNALAQL